MRPEPEGAPPLAIWLRAAILLALVGAALAGLVLSGANVSWLLL